MDRFIKTVIFAAIALFVAAGAALAADAPDIGKYFDAKYLETAREYQLYGYIIYAGNSVLEILFILAAVFWFGKPLSAFVEKISRFTIVRGAVFALALFFLIEILLMPIWYVSFLRGKTYDLIAMGFSTALFRHFISIAVSAFVIAIVSGFLMFAVAKWPKFWWFPAWLGFAILTVLMVFFFPVVVSPLFNEFKPLPEGPLREGTLAIAKKAGVEVGDVLVNDESAYTNYANAYFTGLGATKRIVLYNTLLDETKYSQAEVFDIVAHEIGHWKEEHVFKGLALSLLASFAALALAAWLLVRIRKWKRLDMENPRDLRALPLLALIIGAMAFLANPAENALSRHFERQADEAAFTLAGDPQTYVAMDVKLTKQNLGAPDPPAFLQWYFGTHPTSMERIGAALEFEKNHPAEKKSE